MDITIKFKDITSATELRSRIIRHIAVWDEFVLMWSDIDKEFLKVQISPKLSVGNKISVVRKFGTENRVSADQVETAVTYTARYGNAKKVWFI